MHLRLKCRSGSNAGERHGIAAAFEQAEVAAKALSSDIRLQILAWLKQPEQHFPPTHAPNGWAEGVCVTHIQQKAGLSPSTASTHLSVLQRAGLVEASRSGQWTYYRRNEAAITALARQIEQAL